MEQQKREELLWTRDESVRHFLKIPAFTALARNADGRFFPVPYDDPRAIAYTPFETVYDLDRACVLSPTHDPNGSASL